MVVAMLDRDKFHEEMRERQRNLIWPDLTRNSRMADVFLWRGSPRPTPVQRISACLFGIVFIGLGATMLSTVSASDSFLKRFIVTLISLSAIALGLKVGFNGVRKAKIPVKRRV